ncbi:uracil-DNA glycosylase [Mycolicibacterium brumae]|uniref:Uncharacterized protein n=1 Tax=Mycolicibacterium brumae TaxID=85968 RepID=A0A2G5P6B5_9MYCO|nr:uracil-DNA glycosylase [Mycolicibacterium brumae]MCV7194036.1 uracil-DNA glycosylase [Mycolicibacterium brumae]PIB73797.1 hypothetical protein CQY22_015395 [Mycolicibacterium brumae]UWW09708.1 uracil-DNA glycosylase [Mycolicibacterium brumae]
MARKMADPEFRTQQEQNKTDPHMKRINEFVASLQDKDAGKWLPEVAPMHGGVDARVLSVLRDPGPATKKGKGPGFLCVENDDPTAERQANLFTKYGIDPRDVLPWNAYPWYIHESAKAPNAAQLEDGADVLCRLIGLLPDLRVVLLQGRHAENVWKRVLKRRPNIETELSLTVVGCIHPSPQALWAKPPVPEQRLAKQQKAYEATAAALKDKASPK